ncbi:hypothetical protein N7471_005774 [Penicillium samsonianum]|uniref:uncharacterized protein n=1 Tax=Penicillium samsonianum TaxID=1882272 RepID=UPI00254709FB|nr:uncharacterized protein N7471_005774 [Penicillium samsonianum]KAJ6139288.1 hypothetical protein N7471_005774 [Penicillium samsonianum]
MNPVTNVTSTPCHHVGIWNADSICYSFKDELPTLYDIYETQNFSSDIAASSSYWLSSYVTDFNNEHYVIISHSLASGNGVIYRASTLSLGPSNAYASYVSSANLSANAVTDFNITTHGYGFAALSDDKLSKIRSWSDHDGVVFDITFGATSPVIFNGGAGQFLWMKIPANEWAMPACRTTGSITVNGKEVKIDPNRSFTWYDRQWNYNHDLGRLSGGASTGGSTGNWTWFQIHLDYTPIKASIWAIDIENPHERDRFATIRSNDGSLQFLPVGFSADMTKTWVSEASGVEYPLKWNLDFAHGDFLSIESVTANQEMFGQSASNTAYEGFVFVSGRMRNQRVTGFGIVEMTSM